MTDQPAARFVCLECAEVFGAHPHARAADSRRQLEEHWRIAKHGPAWVQHAGLDRAKANLGLVPPEEWEGDDE